MTKALALTDGRGAAEPGGAALPRLTRWGRIVLLRGAMIVRKSALVMYPAEQMFDLIERAEDYPAFLPWCAAASILSRDETEVAAEITVDFHGVRFHLTTRNPKRRPDHMTIVLERGPFRRFEGEWRLTPLSTAGCKIDFGLQYEFDNRLVGRLAGPVFDRITNSLVDAFVLRAQHVHGPPRDIRQ